LPDGKIVKDKNERNGALTPFGENFGEIQREEKEKGNTERKLKKGQRGSYPRK